MTFPVDSFFSTSVPQLHCLPLAHIFPHPPPKKKNQKLSTSSTGRSTDTGRHLFTYLEDAHSPLRADAMSAAAASCSLAVSTEHHERERFPVHKVTFYQTLSTCVVIIIALHTTSRTPTSTSLSIFFVFCFFSPPS